MDDISYYCVGYDFIDLPSSDLFGEGSEEVGGRKEGIMQ